MPQCTVCTHPARDAIDRDLIVGKSFRYVALRFGVSSSALFRHKRDHIAADLARLSAARDLGRSDRLVEQAQAQEAAAAAHALDLLDELQQTFVRIRKLFDACDRWLADPDDPERYDLGPRAEEVLVHYTVPGPGGVRLPAKAPLSELLAQAGVSGAGCEPGRVEFKHADPRELILKAAHRLEAELQLVARLLGQLTGPAEPLGGSTTVNVLVASPEWVATRTAILNALAPYPEARRAVAEAIQHAAAGD